MLFQHNADCFFSQKKSICLPGKCLKIVHRLKRGKVLKKKWKTKSIHCTYHSHHTFNLFTLLAVHVVNQTGIERLQKVHGNLLLFFQKLYSAVQPEGNMKPQRQLCLTKFCCQNFNCWGRGWKVRAKTFWQAGKNGACEELGAKKTFWRQANGLSFSYERT